MNGLMHKPLPGSELLMQCGNVLEFTLELPNGQAGLAWLRTNIAGATVRRREIIEQVEQHISILTRDWSDVPMRQTGEKTFSVTVPMLAVGRFEAKAFFLPERDDKPVWPSGGNVVIKVEPADSICSNNIYTAFVRQFGHSQHRSDDRQRRKHAIEQLEADGYNIIPRSGTFRDLIKELDFIIDKLRFRIIQLLPIHPIPTTYARMGRFGSPFAALDFLDVDPAMAEFDRVTTPMDQLQELVDAVHERGAKIFIDIPINHTGWASRLQNDHPEWFARDKNMAFKSPGAWGVTWEDLSKLDYHHRELWQYMAGVFLFWCRHGIDGFRCDAGYMIPQAAWEYIIAKTRCEYPDTIFMLEGLGGKQETMEKLLLDANMNWAYSELFQNYDRAQIESYLPNCINVSSRKGLLVHFAETHDNDRLAARSHAYARMRTALAALCSQQGAFGITNGVEWFASDKIDVHGASFLNWGSRKNQVEHIARLNTILEKHPAFHGNVNVRLIETGAGNSIALLRNRSGNEQTSILVLINLDDNVNTRVSWRKNDYSPDDNYMYDLITGRKMKLDLNNDMISCELSAGEVLCLTSDKIDLTRLDEKKESIIPQKVITQRFRAKVLEVNNFYNPNMDVSAINLEEAAAEMSLDPQSYCAGLCGGNAPMNVISWEWPNDSRRVVMVPSDCFLYINAPYRFTAELKEKERVLRHEQSLPTHDKTHFALILPPGKTETTVTRTLTLAVFEPGKCRKTQSDIMYLGSALPPRIRTSFDRNEIRERDCYAICANKQGAMALIRGAWGEIKSQYDAFLAANLNANYPVDRHIMLTRCRVWLLRHGYYQDVDYDCMKSFSVNADGSVLWRFDVPAGQGKLVHLDIAFKIHENNNSATIQFYRQSANGAADCLQDDAAIDIVVRPDIEDRISHGKTKAYAGLEPGWRWAVTPYDNGFRFAPCSDRSLNVTAPGAIFVSEPEWVYMVSHSIDADRGMDGSSDLFSPGYFRFSLKGRENCRIGAAVNGEPETEAIRGAENDQESDGEQGSILLKKGLYRAISSFVVNRDELKTVIAGYPWFLDWGRDTLICLRGMIAAGMLDEARNILKEFARFERQGTLPNAIHGQDASNRDTSDAPLWFFTACSDLIQAEGNDNCLSLDCDGRTIREVLKSIAESYIRGTNNGIKMDTDSGLIFSPSHFTWMDTNYPAGTPREGYPVEIQALWHAALMLLARIEPNGAWNELADKVSESILKYFFDGRRGYLSDCLHARSGRPADTAEPDDALRPNQLLAITLGAVKDMDISKRIIASCEKLLVPGAIRSLADKPVSYALPVYHQGKTLNNPAHPYWGQYHGDEDTRRKPAYHNGTAWTWLFPSYSEALVSVYGEKAGARARAVLFSSSEIINKGCISHIPEILDGDSPHQLRGCGAQAWGATELYRVLAILSRND